MDAPITRLAAYGRDAVLIELAGGVEPHVVADALGDAAVGVERLCGWESVLVTGVDPTRPGALTDALDRAFPATAAPEVAPRPSSHQSVVNLPFRSDGEDLDEVAALTSMTVDALIDAFTTPTYRVVCVGFVRGFTYLSGLDPRLAAVGRRATPRAAVPAGSVAVGGGQTGIYPTTSPGGWRLLGTTDEWLFDPRQRPPCRFSPGDLVRFELTR